MFIGVRDLDKDNLHYVNIEHIVRFVEVISGRTRNGRAVIIYLRDGQEIVTDSIMDNIYDKLDNKHLML